MAEPLGSLVRTHTCGALRTADVGADVVLLGWVHRVRDLGGVTFIDIRDRAGVSQVVVRENDTLMPIAKKLRSEFVIGVSGVVQRRSEETVNPKLATGEVEVLAREIRILNEAKTPPFQIAEDGPVSEDVRLRYRYLDLRRPRLQSNIGLRHRVSMAIRKYFDANGFWEIETPILAKSTPEGARDFLVPSRVHAGEFYALPQSPQIFKQILMIAGTDRYFQIVRCFRDEDQRRGRCRSGIQRARRQPLHAQSAGRARRSGQADGVHRLDLGPARRAAVVFRQIARRGDAAPGARARERLEGRPAVDGRRTSGRHVEAAGRPAAGDRQERESAERGRLRVPLGHRLSAPRVQRRGRALV